MQKTATFLNLHRSQDLLLFPILTVGLLEPRPGASSSELLGLAPSRIRNQQRSVVPNQNILDLLFLLFINILLKERNQRLSYALTDSIDPRCLPTAANTDAHINTAEAMTAEEEDRFEGLVSKDLRFHEFDGDTVDLDQTTSAFAVSDSNCSLLTAKALD